MARLMDYGKKIDTLKAKIERKQAELKGLKEQLADVERKQAASKMQDISAIIQEKGLNPQDVLNVIKEHFQ